MLIVADYDAFLLCESLSCSQRRCISHDEQQSSHHDSADKCAICLFTLSSFTEAESFEYNCVQTENPVEYLIQKEKDITVTFPLLSLRAPPVQLLQSLSWVACIIR